MSERTSSVTWLALDVGGANIKGAHSTAPARSMPFELWKRPDELGMAIRGFLSKFPEFDRLALTMTAELCDCYSTKPEGVNAVLDAALYAVSGRPVSVWGVDGRFHSVDSVRERPRIAAASNWLALAERAASLIPLGAGILIDIGTTTTDLIPLVDGRVAARGRSDTERMQTGELVYAGVRRTPVCALARKLLYRNVETSLSAELFASTQDVYLILGHLHEEPANRSTADGRPATIDAARDRLARMIGADRDDFSLEDARSFAQNAHETLLQRLADEAQAACQATIGQPRAVIVAGTGEFLARMLAERLLQEGGEIIGLATAWGQSASQAACAVALVELAEADGDAPA